MTWMPALQALRGIAALWVVLYHIDVHRWANGLALTGIPGVRFGWLGVDLFFVLSGFLLAPPFYRGGRRVWLFYRDRFMRIAPAYYAAFLAALVLISIRFAPLDWANIALNAVFQTNGNYDTYVAINPVFWTLAVEMQFYLILPAMALLFTRRLWPVAVVAFVAVSVAWRWWTYDGTAPLDLFASVYWLPGFLGHFAIGMGLARIQNVWRPGLLAIVGVLVAVIPPFFLIPEGSIQFGFDDLRGHLVVRPLAALGFGLLVLGASQPGAAARALSGRVLDHLGAISYSLYLIHLVVLYTLDAFIDMGQYPWTFAVSMVVGSLLAGHLLWRFVEDPAQRWWAKRRRAASSQPS